MGTSRLEAFSDGVIAILITIMVLDLRAPAGSSWHALGDPQVMKVLLAYVLSFVFLGIYWTNHHHMFGLVKRVNGRILWANLHLLFWLSLVPFVTAWMDETRFASLPTALYGVVLLCAALAWYLLQRDIVAHEGPQSTLAEALGSDVKGRLSPLLYVAAIGFAFVRPWIADAIYVLVALMWIVPDRRFESRHPG